MSIQVCYLQLIASAEHFIYIENQYLISSTAGNDVHNNIFKAIAHRIKLAHENDEKFKVMIFGPNLILETGDIETGIVRKQVMEYTYKSICRGSNSIFGLLKLRYLVSVLIQRSSRGVIFVVFCHLLLLKVNFSFIIVAIELFYLFCILCHVHYQTEILFQLTYLPAIGVKFHNLQ